MYTPDCFNAITAHFNAGRLAEESLDMSFASREQLDRYDYINSNNPGSIWHEEDYDILNLAA